MAQPEEVPQWAEDAWVRRIVPAYFDEAIAIVLCLSHPNVCDFARAFDVSQNL